MLFPDAGDGLRVKRVVGFDEGRLVSDLAA